MANKIPVAYQAFNNIEKIYNALLPVYGRDCLQTVLQLHYMPQCKFDNGHQY